MFSSIVEGPRQEILLLYYLAALAVDREFIYIEFWNSTSSFFFFFLLLSCFFFLPLSFFLLASLFFLSQGGLKMEARYRCTSLLFCIRRWYASTVAAFLRQNWRTPRAILHVLLRQTRLGGGQLWNEKGEPSRRIPLGIDSNLRLARQCQPQPGDRRKRHPLGALDSRGWARSTVVCKQTPSKYKH